MTENDFIEYLNTPSWGRKLSSSKPDTFKGKVYSKIIELSSLYKWPDDLPLSAKRWLIINDRTKIPLCKTCNREVKWGQELGSFREYCSSICSNKNKDKIEQYINTRINLSDEVKNKIKEKTKSTNKERFGTEYAMQNTEIKSKAFSTNIKKYGSKSSFSSEKIKHKIKRTNKLRYGNENPAKSRKIQQKIENTSNIRYGVKRYSMSDSAKDELRNKWISKYNRERSSQNHISEFSLSKLNDIEWLKSRHHTDKKTLHDIAIELKVNEKTVSNYLKYNNIDIKYNKSNSSAELDLLDYIVSISPYAVESNNRTILKNINGNPIGLDIYIDELKLAIEFCCIYWHSEIYKSQDYHKTKLDLCKAKGIELLTIFEDEWYDKEEIIKKKLLYKFGKISNKIYARKTDIILVDKITKSIFFEENHIQGDGPSSINYGLVDKDVLVACIGFIKNNDGSYNLNRYATSQNVVGGFTKLLSHFETVYNKPKIITFADLRWSEGDLYYKTGFIMDKELKPDYYWARKYNRYHKFNFRHTTGLKKLENYDPNLSESENMHNHGYYKIYDCGKLRFIK